MLILDDVESMRCGEQLKAVSGMRNQPKLEDWYGDFVASDKRKTW